MSVQFFCFHVLTKTLCHQYNCFKLRRESFRLKALFSFLKEVNLGVYYSVYITSIVCFCNEIKIETTINFFYAYFVILTQIILSISTYIILKLLIMSIRLHSSILWHKLVCQLDNSNKIRLQLLSSKFSLVICVYSSLLPLYIAYLSFMNCYVITHIF